MAKSNDKINISNFTSIIAIVFILFQTFGSIFVVFFWSRDNFYLLNSYEFKVLYFTLKQALISSLLVCLLAIPISKAIFRNNFILKGIFIKIMGLPFIFPVVSAIFSIILIFGNNGFINTILEMLGFSKISIYGLKGIVIINIFFNLPLAVRFLILAWNEIPSEQLKLAKSLNVKSLNYFKLIELPMLRSILPSTLCIIFLICISSFSVALTLGGGPNSTTLEVAIYQALVFDFDFAKASSLASIQFLVCIILAIFVIFFSKKNSSFASQEIKFFGVNSLYMERSLIDWFWIIFAVLFLLVPILFLIFTGFFGIFYLPKTIFLAALNSVVLAVFSGFLGVCLALSLTNFFINLTSSSKYFEILSIFILATSPIVMGTGLFLVLKTILNLEILTPLLVIIINATMSLPFMLRVLLPAVTKVNEDTGKLSDSLDIYGFDRFKLITFPTIFPAISFSMGLGCALSMGDLGVITLFSFADFQTLPLAIYRLMMSYKMDHAISSSVLLIIICFFLFQLFDYLGKLYALR